MNCPNFASNLIGAELISSPPFLLYLMTFTSSQYQISHFFTVMISGTFLICICGNPFQCFLDIFSPNQCFQTKQTIKKLLSSLEKLSKTKFDDLFATFIKDWTVLCNLTTIVELFIIDMVMFGIQPFDIASRLLV